MLRANGSNPELLFLPASLRRGLCKIFSQFPLSWGTWVWTGGGHTSSLGQVMISAHHHFPTQSSLSHKLLCLGPTVEPVPDHTAPSSCQTTAASQVSHLQPVCKQSLVPVCEAWVPLCPRGHGRAGLQALGCSLFSEVTGSCELLCGDGHQPAAVPGGIMAQQDRVRMPRNLLLPGSLLYNEPRNWGSNNWLRDTNLPR